MIIQTQNIERFLKNPSIFGTN